MGKRKKKYPRNWKGYNFAQKVQLPLFLDLVRIFVRNLEVEERPKEEEERKKGGRPPYPTKDAIKCLLLWSYFQGGARKALGRIETYKEKVEIESDLPSFNSLLNFQKDKYLCKCVEKVAELIFLTISHGDKSLTTDSTGRSTSKKKFWNDWKGEKRKSKDFVKEHFTFGARTLMVAAHTTTPSKGKGTGDSSQMEIHVGRIVGLGIKPEEWSGDGSYCARKCAKAIAKTGATPFIKIKKNATAKKKGVAAFRDMVLMKRKHPIIYKRHYRKSRPKAESGIYSFKSNISHRVRARNFNSQVGESAAGRAVFNLLRFSHAIFEFGIIPNSSC